jgi:hypothetical protein
LRTLTQRRAQQILSLHEAALLAGRVLLHRRLTMSTMLKKRARRWVFTACTASASPRWLLNPQRRRYGTNFLGESLMR